MILIYTRADLTDEGLLLMDAGKLEELGLEHLLPHPRVAWNGTMNAIMFMAHDGSSYLRRCRPSEAASAFLHRKTFPHETGAVIAGLATER